MQNPIYITDNKFYECLLGEPFQDICWEKGGKLFLDQKIIFALSTICVDTCFCNSEEFVFRSNPFLANHERRRYSDNKCQYSFKSQPITNLFMDY